MTLPPINLGGTNLTDGLSPLPTGEYDNQSSVNVGSNVYSIVPYYAFTLFLTSKWETSWRLHAIRSSKNTDPFTRLRAPSTQSGRAFFFNYGASYDLGHVRAGAAGVAATLRASDRRPARPP